ncbi:MAG: hypothetical protein AB4290_23545 [Spirulina sp.]
MFEEKELLAISRETTREEAIPQESSSVENFRFAFQGKQMSQIVAYIWRWADDENLENAQKAEVAMKLREYFVKPNTSLQNNAFTKDAHQKNVDEDLLNSNLKRLFRADPRAWLQNPDDYREQEEEVKLLISVFGKERILDPDKYISPMFNSHELGETSQGRKSPHYEFHIDVSSFLGILRDPDLARPCSFLYTISFPPRPQLGKLTVTTDELENWVKNEDLNVIYPDNLYMPVSTS